MITRGALCLICLSAIASSAVSRPPECPENFCFFVQDLSKNGEELIGDFEFWNLTFDPVRLPPNEIIRGVQRADGNFYPYVTLQVSRSRGGPWSTVRSVMPVGRRVKVIVPPTIRSSPLKVDFGPFRPLLHTMRWGRVLLPDGHAATFALKELDEAWHQKL